MARRFPIILLTVLTIFLLIGMCVSLPYPRDMAIQPGNCDKSVPHVVIINSTDNTILNCPKCEECKYIGHGLSIPCNGQNITYQEVNVECVPCVAGVNYSTGDTIQCKSCGPKNCSIEERVVGKCEPDGDKRKCEKCGKNSYYNDTQKHCLPCDCHNMTPEKENICRKLGFDTNICTTWSPTITTTNHTNTPNSQKDDEKKVWETEYTIIVVVCGITILLIVYSLCVRMRTKKLKIDNPHLSVCSKKWFCRVFCFKQVTRSRPPSYTVEDRNAPNGNGCTESVSFLRQNSCPVTQNEKCVVNNCPHAVSFNKQGDGPERVQLLDNMLRECEQKKLTFFGMNSETCRQILQALKHNIDSGMGYPTLAGLMGFTANQVKDFEENGKPCENMLKHWSSLDTKENNVLKLKGLVAKLKRDDILELLKKELKEAKGKCGCPECKVV